jgi:hypothetical protein
MTRLDQIIALVEEMVPVEQVSFLSFISARTIDVNIDKGSREVALKELADDIRCYWRMVDNSENNLEAAKLH